VSRGSSQNSGCISRSTAPPAQASPRSGGVLTCDCGLMQSSFLRVDRNVSMRQRGRVYTFCLLFYMVPRARCRVCV